jgi:hypothetical protein
MSFGTWNIKEGLDRIMDRAVLRVPLLLAALIAIATSPALARDEIRTEKVQFKRGATSATINGKIRGYEVVDFVLEASKGQQMNVSMATDNLASYFNILAPGEENQAMFVGSTSGNQFEGGLPKSGAYKIRVYMMRSAARREEAANYRLEMSITGAPQKAGSSSGAKAGAANGGMPSKDEQACLQAVSLKTNVGDVVTLSVETSEANTIVMVGVGPNRAPWKCLASDGAVAEVMSMTDKGPL